MALWIMQISLNFVFGALGIALLLNRRDQKRLEAEVERLRMRLGESGGATAFSGPSSEPRIESTPRPTPSASIAPASLMDSVGLARNEENAPRLIEKAPPADRGRINYEAYDVAQKLMARGLDVREVSRRTGLSVAELHLIGKVSHKNH